MRNELTMMVELALSALVVPMPAACAEAATGIQPLGRCDEPISETTPAVVGSVGIGHPLLSYGAEQKVTTAERAVSALKVWHVFGANVLRDHGRLRVSAGQSVARQMGRKFRFPRSQIPHPRT